MNTEFNSVVWWDLRNGQETNNNNSSSLYGWRQYGDYGIVDSVDPAGPADTYPTFYVDRLLQHFARGGDQLVSSSSDYPLLSVCAAQRNGGGLTLLVVNKSPTIAFNTNITVSGASPGSTGTLYSYGIPQDNAAKTGVGSADIATSSCNRAIDKLFIQLPGLLGQRDRIRRRWIVFTNAHCDCRPLPLPPHTNRTLRRRYKDSRPLQRRQRLLTPTPTRTQLPRQLLPATPTTHCYCDSDGDTYCDCDRRTATASYCDGDSDDHYVRDRFARVRQCRPGPDTYRRI